MAAMESLCGSPFWEPSYNWTEEKTPDLTLCFQDTVLLWVPCAFLWLCAPFEAHAMNKSGKRRLPWTALNVTKVVLSVVLTFVACIELGQRLVELAFGATLFPVDFVTPSVRIATFVLTVLLVRGGRRAGFHTSAPLFLFWTFMSITSGIRYRSLMLNVFGGEENRQLVSDLEFQFVVVTIYFAITLCQFFLSCFADRSALRRLKAGKCPEQYASFPSTLVFWWFNGIIFKGYREPLKMSDMWELDKENATADISKRFDRLYRGTNEKKDTPKSDAAVDGAPTAVSERDIMMPLFRTFLPDLIISGFHKLAACLLIFVSPVVLDMLIRFMNSDEPSWRGVLYAAAMFFASMGESLFNSQYEYRIFLVSMRMRSAMINAIYRKALTLSSASKGFFTTGEIVNLMSVDTQRIMEYIQVFNFLWSTPIQVVLATYLLWQQLGVATVGGLAVMIGLLPVNAFITGFLRKYQVSVMEQKDRRIKLMNEMLAGIKVLKLYAWETAFEKRVKDLRNKELRYLKIQAYLNAAVVFSFACAPFLVSLTSFGMYVLIDSRNILDANKAFVSLTLFNTLRVPLAFLPLIISNTAMFLVSVARINDFLRSDDLDPRAVLHGSEQDDKPVKFVNASFAWSRTGPATLHDITLSVPKGSLVAIVGSVGSGKSSLLSACLGDLVKLEGSVTVSGTVAYSPQQAWIQNNSVKNNILFGKSYDHDRYEQVIEACALKTDLAVLPAGDETEIGEKGINLSGGQKQRISIARAVYSDRDIYLFDDPLSAVDSNVGKHIFEKVIGPDGMLGGKTRVLVTHRLSVLPDVDTVVVLRDGTVSDVGTFQELVSRGGAFSDFLVQFIQESEGEGRVSEEDVKLFSELASRVSSPLSELTSYCSKFSGSDADDGSSGVEDGHKKGLRKRTMSKRSSIGGELDSCGNIRPMRRHLSKAQMASKAKLTEEETAQVGSVKWWVYWEFTKAMGIWITLGTLATYVISHAFNMGGSIWVSVWTDDAFYPSLATDPGQRRYRLGMYAMYGIFETVFVLFGSVSLNLAVLQGSRQVHQGMLHRVLRAPMSFFDTTPMGRILNRFSKDIDAADVTLPFNGRMLLVQFLRTVVAFVLIAMETPIFLAAVAPIIFIYYFVQKVYIATSRQLKRLESITRSPIYVHFSETVTGSSSIRAYGATDRFVALSDHLTDINHSTYFPSVVATRWLATRLEFLGYCIVFIAAFLAALGRGTLSPGMAGLSVSYALTVTMTLNMLVRSTSDTETNLVAVERCFEYARVPQEAPWENPDFKPDPSWPTAGKVVFEEYSTRYRSDLDLVLKEITCAFNPGEKVGIVGRTGAGKSSLTLALFRIIEACNGAINIDGLDISTLGLYDLRSKLTIIPQDPVLFSGTLRSNLDPFDTKSDHDIWRALEQSHLKDFVTGVEKGLLHDIVEGGENISVGQRQLVCLARALLRKSRILILDEATAAVDMETDDLIQATIRREFSDCTIITIAHRLNTILDYDRVIVLDNGLVAETGSPQDLLKTETTRFYAMAKDANLVPQPDQA